MSPETSSAADSKDAQLPPHPMYTKEPRASFTPQYIETETKKSTTTEEYFIFRPSVVQQAVKNITESLSEEEDGQLHSSWILAQISHWGTEREVLVFLCERSVVICYYNFLEMGSCRLFRIPLNYIDTVIWGPLAYSKMALNKREGYALQVKWDKLRAPPSFLSWWNPWTEDLSYINLIQHPGVATQEDLKDMCQLEQFMEKLMEMVKVAHQRSPLPGRANGPFVLQRPVQIDTSVGLVSLLNSKVQLGYAKPRWGFGF
ncbi:PREDICTED: tumor protein p63-regulated gene 1-like protein [Nanorana parkeri]|uniref:tumor protein p63-regulated gene 1-like protein n=1 Tax=Nanorana parkeri TaxID=125878 RepID=UPI000854A8EA|nr:PREDICTED: tumor protein p63-regulated gene 1-like protein [Nanorana parkeri]